MMDPTTHSTETEGAGSAIAIPAPHSEAADRYIAAIVGRDPLVDLLGPTYVVDRAAQLWDDFVEVYTRIATGPYARRGDDALRIALGRI